MITTTNSADHYQEYIGLSTDTKPENIANGSIFLEIDTKKVFIFDEENLIWREF